MPVKSRPPSDGGLDATGHPYMEPGVEADLAEPRGGGVRCGEGNSSLLWLLLVLLLALRPRRT